MSQSQIPLIKGDKTGSETDYRDGLPINMYAVQKNILGAAGYMQNYSGIKLFGPDTAIILEDSPIGIVVDAGRVVDTGGQIWAREVMESESNEIIIGQVWKSCEVTVRPLDYEPFRSVTVYIGLDATFSNYVLAQWLHQADYQYYEIQTTNESDSTEVLTGYDPDVPVTFRVDVTDTNIELYQDDVLIISTPSDAGNYPPTNGGYISIKSTDDEFEGWESNINHVLVTG